MPGNTSKRSDRQSGHRGAYEAARQKILKTQTICGICGKPVDFSFRNPHPLAPTVDHIIPVSKGGHPSDISNLQLAHRCCNRAKADKMMGDRMMNEKKKAGERLSELFFHKENKGVTKHHPQCVA